MGMDYVWSGSASYGRICLLGGSRMGTWHFWCYMREIIEQYCGKDFYKKNGEWITNHFAALISDEDMRSCCYPSEDDIRLWLKREGFCKGE